MKFKYHPNDIQPSSRLTSSPGNRGEDVSAANFVYFELGIVGGVQDDIAGWEVVLIPSFLKMDQRIADWQKIDTMIRQKWK